MDEENKERNIEEMKRLLLIQLMHSKFEDYVYEHLEDGEEESIEELDAWLDREIRIHMEKVDAVNAYFKNKMNLEERN